MSASPSDKPREGWNAKDMLDLTGVLVDRWSKRYTTGAIARLLAIDTVSRAMFDGRTKAEIDLIVAEMERTMADMTKSQRRSARVKGVLRRTEALLTRLEKGDRKRKGKRI